MKLSSVRIGGNKSNKQLSEIENITKFYKLREVIKFYNDYFKMGHKAAYENMEKDSKHELLNKFLKDSQYHLHK